MHLKISVGCVDILMGGGSWWRGAGGGEVAPNKSSFTNSWLYIPTYATLFTLVGTPHGGFPRLLGAVSGEMKWEFGWVQRDRIFREEQHGMFRWDLSPSSPPARVCFPLTFEPVPLSLMFPSLPFLPLHWSKKNRASANYSQIK